MKPKEKAPDRREGLNSFSNSNVSFHGKKERKKERKGDLFSTVGKGSLLVTL